MFSPKRYFEVFATTLLLLVGLPQFIAPILKWQTVSGAAYAQSNTSVRLSRSVNYNNANSPDAFQDDQLSYSLTLENHEGIALTGTPIFVDGQQAQRVMVASVIPAGTYLAGAPYAPQAGKRYTAQMTGSKQAAATTAHKSAGPAPAPTAAASDGLPSSNPTR